MRRWEHLSEVREDVKSTLSAEYIKYEKQDLGIGIVVDGMYHDKSVSQRITAILSSANNPIRIPELCDAVLSAHPDLKQSQAIAAVRLFCGLSVVHVKRLYYRRMRCSISK